MTADYSEWIPPRVLQGLKNEWSGDSVDCPPFWYGNFWCGDTWCGRCGFRRVPNRRTICPICRDRPKLGDVACGVCGAPSEVMFVYGYRCREHQYVRQPDCSFESEGMIGCFGRLLKLYTDKKDG